MANRKTSKPVDPVECEVLWLGFGNLEESGCAPYCSLTLHLQPVPASRPRVTRWGTYYLKTYDTWRQIAMASVPEAKYQFTGQVVCHTRFAIQKARTSKLDRPIGDIDNYEKGIYDILTRKGYWLDDVEIVKHSVKKFFTDSGGQVTVQIGPA